MASSHIPHTPHSHSPSLQWLTGQEKDNVGFIVFRKRVNDVGGGGFEEVASFENFPPLNSRGWVRYSFVPVGGHYHPP